MTKKFHVCDEKCEPAGTGIHNTDQAKKTKLPSGTKVKSTKKSADKAFNKQKEKIAKTKDFKEKYVETEFGKVRVHISNVYDPNYSEIDNTIEDIKKASRLVSSNEYSTNNVYLILQDALKKILLAES
tara:strand:+ start:395 stop:778 length:384 start_codon:yes stop_codon:yes gene_type:complete